MVSITSRIVMSSLAIPLLLSNSVMSSSDHRLRHASSVKASLSTSTPSISTSTFQEQGSGEKRNDGNQRNGWAGERKAGGAYGEVR